MWALAMNGHPWLPEHSDDAELRKALVAALREITDHFAAVMGGPLITGQGVRFQHGVEGIPTIAAARAVLAKAETH